MRKENISGTVLAALLSLSAILVLAQQYPVLAQEKDVKTAEEPKTHIYVRTVPAGAKIQLNGELLGTSDDVFAVPSGTGQIVVELDGHVTEKREIVIRPGRITRLVLELDKSPGFVQGFAQDKRPEPQFHFDDTGQLKAGTWHDLLQWADPAQDAVKGAWSRSGKAVLVKPHNSAKQHLRMALPVVVEGGYDVEMEFTRLSGNDSVGLSLPVGSGGCIFHLSAFAGRFAGLDMVAGRGIGTPGKSDDSQPSKLINNRRYRLLVRVRTDGGDTIVEPLLEETRSNEPFEGGSATFGGGKATVEALLDGSPCVRWSGKQSALHIWHGWRLPHPKQLGLIANESAVTFHSVKLRPVSRKAYRAKRVAERRESMPIDKWVDLLKLTDVKRCRVRGEWMRDEKKVVVSSVKTPDVNDCLMLPAQVQGSYDFEVQFTRINGNDSVILNLPAGSRACTLQLSAWEGNVGGLEMIHGMAVGVVANPAVVRPNTLANGSRYTVLAKVRIEGIKASVDVLLNGKAFVRWKGPTSALGTWGGWTMPRPSRPALGSNKNIVWFHSAKLRRISGKAALLTVEKGNEPRRSTKPAGEPSTTSAGGEPTNTGESPRQRTEESLPPVPPGDG